MSAIAQEFHRLAGVDSVDADVAALFCMSTFVAASLQCFLRAVVAGRDDWEATQFMRLLSCFCYHALPLAIFDVDHVWRLPKGAMPTFLVSDPSFTVVWRTQPEKFKLRAEQGNAQP